MSISRATGKKSPAQDPVKFFQCKQTGGPGGSKGKTVPDKISSGSQREKVWGKKSMSK